VLCKFRNSHNNFAVRISSKDVSAPRFCVSCVDPVTWPCPAKQWPEGPVPTVRWCVSLSPAAIRAVCPSLLCQKGGHVKPMWDFRFPWQWEVTRHTAFWNTCRETQLCVQRHHVPVTRMQGAKGNVLIDVPRGHRFGCMWPRLQSRAGFGCIEFWKDSFSRLVPVVVRRALRLTLSRFSLSSRKSGFPCHNTVIVLCFFTCGYFGRMRTKDSGSRSWKPQASREMCSAATPPKYFLVFNVSFQWCRLCSQGYNKHIDAVSLQVSFQWWRQYAPSKRWYLPANTESQPRTTWASKSRTNVTRLTILDNLGEYCTGSF
jgi:hypothetical protein